MAVPFANHAAHGVAIASRMLPPPLRADLDCRRFATTPYKSNRPPQIGPCVHTIRGDDLIAFVGMGKIGCGG
jgi:hypothetical protein